jgi:signal transduction histidine kinase
MSSYRRRTSTAFVAVRPVPSEVFDGTESRSRLDANDPRIDDLTRKVEDRHALLARIDDLRAEQRELYAKCIKAERAERRKDDLRPTEPSDPIAVDARKPGGNPARSARHLLSVIRDVLDLAKLESGQAALEKSTTLARTCVVEACDVVANQASRKRVVLELDAASNRAVDADPVRLTRVISNLVANAVARAPEASAVRVHTVDDRDSVLFSITYEGAAGFAFSSRSSEGREDGADMELALDISRKILALHATDLVVSEGDRGIFSFRLAACGPDSASQAPAESGVLPRR